MLLSSKLPSRLLARRQRFRCAAETYITQLMIRADFQRLDLLAAHVIRSPRRKRMTPDENCAGFGNVGSFRLSRKNVDRDTPRKMAASPADTKRPLTPRVSFSCNVPRPAPTVFELQDCEPNISVASCACCSGSAMSPFASTRPNLAKARAPELRKLFMFICCLREGSRL